MHTCFDLSRENSKKNSSKQSFEGGTILAFPIRYLQELTVSGIKLNNLRQIKEYFHYITNN